MRSNGAHQGLFQILLMLMSSWKSPYCCRIKVWVVLRCIQNNGPLCWIELELSGIIFSRHVRSLQMMGSSWFDLWLIWTIGCRHSIVINIRTTNSSFEGLRSWSFWLPIFFVVCFDNIVSVVVWCIIRRLYILNQDMYGHKWCVTYPMVCHSSRYGKLCWWTDEKITK